MSKPDDIAMAVRDQLCIDCVCTFRDGCGCTDAISAAIEAAILGERERCAKIAEEAGNTWSGTRDAEQACQEAAVDDKCVEIATDIRKGD